jgi:pimeloyl-ACP methyl ester carboxylesterase
VLPLREEVIFRILAHSAIVANLPPWKGISVRSLKTYPIVLLAAFVVIFTCVVPYASAQNAGDILFTSTVGGTVEGVFRVASSTNAESLVSLNAQCPQFLRDIAIGEDGSLFLLLDCNGILPDLAQWDPDTDTLMPIVEDNVLFRTIDLTPDRHGNFLILCEAGCSSLQNGVPVGQGMVIRVDPATGVVSSAVHPAFVGPFNLQLFIPRGVAVDQQDRIFLVGFFQSTAPGNAVVVRVDPANALAELFISLPNLETIDDIAIGSNGQIYVGGTLRPAPPTFAPQGVMIQINPANSGDQTVFSGGLLTNWNAVDKIALDLNGDILMASYRGILRLTPATGAQTLVFDPPPGSPGFAPRAVAVAPGSISPLPPLAALTLIDPVPQLLSGPRITTAATAADALPGQPYLADLTKGREVQGLAADGVAQVVIRIPANSVGEQFALTVREDQCAALTISGCIDEYGLLFDPTRSPSNIFGNQPSLSPIVTAVSTADGPMAFAAYRAPVDFVRSGALNASDRTAAQRSVFISINNGNGAQLDLEIKLVRPPVVFLHGVNSDATIWRYFTPLINKKNIYSINTINYGSRLAPRKIACSPDPSSEVGMICDLTVDISSIGQITPTTDTDTEQLIKESMLQSALGFSYNAQYVNDKIEGLLGLGNVPATDVKLFKNGNNPIGVPVANVQVDIIGHSMGGLVARTMPTLTAYAQNRNYNRGSIHKLITIGTPHLGSPQALYILKDENRCFRENFVKLFFKNSIDIQSVVLSSSLVSGGTGDLAGIGLKKVNEGGVILPSPAIQQLDASIPLALIAGDMGDRIDDLQFNFVRTVVANGCGSNPLSDFFSTENYSKLFDPFAFVPARQNLERIAYRSDAIVPLTSALNSDVDLNGVSIYQVNSPASFEELEQRDGGKIFKDVVHGLGTLDLGFHGPFLLQEETGIPAHTELLLNTSVNDTIFKRNYGRF